MARQKLPFVTGWCNSAQLIEGGHASSQSPEWFHKKCAGGVARPDVSVTKLVGGKLNRKGELVGAKEQLVIEAQEPKFCECPCHAGQEIVVKPVESVAKARIKVATQASESGVAPSGRNKKLREAIAAELQSKRMIELEKTGDAYEDRKLVCRIHSAAKGVGLKVKTSCKGEKITGTVV